MGSGGMRVLECLEPDLFSEIGILDQPGLDVQQFIFIHEMEPGFAILNAICIGLVIRADGNDNTRRYKYRRKCVGGEASGDRIWNASNGVGILNIARFTNNA